MIHNIKNFGDRIIAGGAVFYRTTPCPPLRLPSNTRSTVGERDLRRQGDQTGRFGSGQTGIVWILSEAGGH